jgi:hypothetical protein
MVSEHRHPVIRIVSGGQTGVDRGALDAAMEIGIPHGGWCPRGRLAEDGRIPDRYLLQETRSPEYRARTEQNVIDSDGTLILFRQRIVGGTELTRRLARKHRKPLLAVDLDDARMAAGAFDVEQVLAWLVRHGIGVLNVAGPRESSSPEITAAATAFVRELFAD